MFRLKLSVRVCELSIEAIAGIQQFRQTALPTHHHRESGPIRSQSLVGSRAGYFFGALEPIP